MRTYTIGSKKIENICVIGGGNEGHYFLALLGSKKELNVSLLTRQPEIFQNRIESVNGNTGEETIGNIDKVSDDASVVIPDADMIIFLVPSNAYSFYIEKIKPYVKEGTIIGFVPGTGGVEFVAKCFLDKGCPIFGTQRVPSGTKILIKGQKVESLGSRKDLRISCIPSSMTEDVCSVLGELLEITTVALPNYLAVTFTPSNPILHTSRLFGLFHNYLQGEEYDRNLSFYKDWDNYSSEILLGCNDELQECCRRLTKYDLRQVLSLREHYEIDGVKGKDDIEKMTNKISHLVYLKDLVPMVQLDNGKYIPNFQSRYFTEDFPFGLSIIKSFCEVCDVKTPNIDAVLGWYSNMFKKNYYVDNEFKGEGLKELPIPQNYGIEDINLLYAYYDGLESRFKK